MVREGGREDVVIRLLSLSNLGCTQLELSKPSMMGYVYGSIIHSARHRAERSDTSRPYRGSWLECALWERGACGNLCLRFSDESSPSPALKGVPPWTVPLAEPYEVQ